MAKRLLGAVAFMAVVATALVQVTAGSTQPGAQMSFALRDAIHGRSMEGHLHHPTLSGGVVASYEDAVRSAEESRQGSASSAIGAPPISYRTGGCRHVFTRLGFPNNVRSNQDCGLRREAEEDVAVNPKNSGNVIVGQNFSPLGFNQTGINWSTDGGAHWGTYGAPTRFLNGDGFGNDAYSDPAQAFDANGNLYYTAVGFNLNSPDGNIVVWRSDAKNKGSFLHTPGDEFGSNPSVVFDNQSDPTISPDKEWIAADSSKTSPFKNNVYVTWTNFKFACGAGHVQFCSADIMFSKSTDGGQTWSAPMNISGSSSVCVLGNAFDKSRGANDCDLDQGSVPVVSKNGDINVAFNNCNTPATAGWGPTIVCQQLFVKSTDGGSTWSAPVKVATDYSTQPYNVGSGPNAAGCDSFRQCLPPNGYRMDDFPSIGVDQTNGNLAVTWADFRDAKSSSSAPPGSACTMDPTTGLPTTPCANENNDVFVSVSKDGGTTWGPARLATGNGGKTAQWQPWGDYGENGKLYAAYYDRRYGKDETNGKNDITLAVSGNGGKTWSHRRITTSSMPNLLPSNNPIQAGFLGDYMGLEWMGGLVNITWADTRGLMGQVEEDAYFARLKA